MVSVPNDWSSDGTRNDVPPDARSDRVLGCNILGPLAGDLLAEVVLAMEFGGTAEDIARTCHSHPGMGEAVKEAERAELPPPLDVLEDVYGEAPPALLEQRERLAEELREDGR